MSQQGLCGLTYPFITCESSFRSHFLEGNSSVFRDCWWVKRGCLGWRIHSPPVKAVSGAISELATSQFSLTVYESIGAVWADESIHHLWKQFQGPLLRGQLLNFSWLLMSQKGLFGLMNPFATCESSFGVISEWAASQFFFSVYESTWVVWADESIHHLWKQFQVSFFRGKRLSFSWLFMSQNGLCGQTNPFVTCERSFEGYFWMGTESVFIAVCESTKAVGADEFIGHMRKEFRGQLLSRQRLRFPRLFMIHQGLFGLTNPFATFESSFGGYIWMGSESVFLDCLWVNRGCVG